MHRFVVGLLIVVSALSLLLASTSLWTRRHVVNTDVFVSDAQVMLSQPAVQDRINNLVTDSVMATPDVQAAVNDALTILPPRVQAFRAPIEDGARSVVSRGVQVVLTSQAFTALTTAVLTSAHSQLVNGQPVRFTLGQAKDLVQDRTGLGGQVLGLIPSNVGITVLTPADAPTLYAAIDILKSLWLWMLLVALAALAGALVMSGQPRRTLRAWSITIAVLGLLVLIALRVAPLFIQTKPVNRDAVNAVYAVIAGSLRTWTIWLIVIALVIVALTLMWGHLGLVAAIRRGYRSAVREVRRRRETHEAAARAVARAVEAEGVDTSADDNGLVAVVPNEPWTHRVAADTKAFISGMGLAQRRVALGEFVRRNLRVARWSGIIIAAVVLLFWPAPTLAVLIWIVAIVALYLGLLELVQAGLPPSPAAPQPAPPPERPETQPDRISPRPLPTRTAAEAVTEGPPAPAPTASGDAGDMKEKRDVVPKALVQGQPTGTTPTSASMPRLRPSTRELTPELISTMGDRLDLLVRLGAARDAGVLTDEEFAQEKTQLLAL